MKREDQHAPHGPRNETLSGLSLPGSQRLPGEVHPYSSRKERHGARGRGRQIDREGGSPSFCRFLRRQHCPLPRRCHPSSNCGGSEGPPPIGETSGEPGCPQRPACSSLAAVRGCALAAAWGPTGRGPGHLCPEDTERFLALILEASWEAFQAPAGL